MIDLWDDLCHQGSVYDDSFLALPYLAAISTGRAPGAPAEAVLMAGLVVSAADDPSSPSVTTAPSPRPVTT
ncbi:hypothetical protein [Streptomyces sp. NPDC051211]|uniref:hypothetical protein n=1 Tax=Streptomyces sp. NPDC051211 TaxID=3154643 RepID=UPI00344E3A9E